MESHKGIEHQGASPSTVEINTQCKISSSCVLGAIHIIQNLCLVAADSSGILISTALPVEAGQINNFKIPFLILPGNDLQSEFSISPRNVIPETGENRLAK